MSWIDTPPGHPYPGWVRLLLRALGRKGTVSQSVRLWARSPRVWLSFLGMYKAVDREGSPLAPSLRSLVMARVSQVNGCAFCVDLNGAQALERGATEEQLASLAGHATSPLFGAREKAALAFADAVTITGAAVTPELRQALRGAFSDDEIVELSALVAFQNLSSKFNGALDVPPEGKCAVPARPPAPGAGKE